MRKKGKSHKVFYAVKRIVDVAGSLFLLLFFSPVLFASMIAIKLTSVGPIFADTPPRVGRDGALFKTYKLRSMIANAHQLLRKDPKFKRLYEEYKKSSFKLFDDPRITPVGKFLRKHSIDEIPQLLNVLKGEMSIVGPRPYYQEELEEQQRKYPHTKGLVGEVLTVKPGITGFWQVTGRSEINFDKRIEMDAYYARKKSIFLDLLVLLKTPWVMISGKGAA